MPPLQAGLHYSISARKQQAQQSSELHYVDPLYTSGGISNEIAYLCPATGVELGETRREPAEPMELRLVPLEEVLCMACEGAIPEGVAVRVQLRLQR